MASVDIPSMKHSRPIPEIHSVTQDLQSLQSLVGEHKRQCTTNSQASSAPKRTQGLPASSAAAARRNGAAAALGSASARGELLAFPMWVLPVAQALRFKALPAHEVLQGQGHLIKWAEGITASGNASCSDRDVGMGGGVTFISHVWHSKSHPDPSHFKWQLLQAIFRTALAGHLHCDDGHPSGDAFAAAGGQAQVPAGYGRRAAEALQSAVNGDGAVWMDYLSVPQDHSPNALNTCKKAMGAIAQYVSLSACLLFLVPPVVCEEPLGERCWESRGWCRMELIANALSPNVKQCIVVRSMTMKYAITGQDWMYAPVGSGNFTDPGDRIFLGLAIRRLVEKRQSQAFEDGDLVMFRFLEAKKSDLLSGTPSRHSFETYAGFADWMQSMEWPPERGVDAGISTGFTLLRFAAIGGRWLAAMRLLECRADVAAPLTINKPEIGARRSCTILHDACAHCFTPNVVELLLSHGADPWRPDNLGMAALHHACWHGRCSNVEAVLHAAPEAGTSSSHGSLGSPWMFCVLRGHTAAIRHFIHECPFQINLDPDCETGFGYGIVSAAVIGDGSNAETLDLVLAQGYSIDHCVKVRPLAARLNVRIAQACCFLHEGSGFAAEYSANVQGTTALHLAAVLGCAAATLQLAALSADVHAKNCYGRSPLALAAMRGHEDVAKVLLRARSDAAASDSWGRTPAQWASSRGHAVLAQLLLKESGGRNEHGRRPWCRRRMPVPCDDVSQELSLEGPHQPQLELPAEPSEVWLQEAPMPTWARGAPGHLLVGLSVPELDVEEAALATIPGDFRDNDNELPDDSRPTYSSPRATQCMVEELEIGEDHELSSGNVAFLDTSEMVHFDELPQPLQKRLTMAQLREMTWKGYASASSAVRPSRPLLGPLSAPAFENSLGVNGPPLSLGDSAPPLPFSTEESAINDHMASDVWWI